MPIDLAQSLENLKLERDAIHLYDTFATIEKDPARAAAFRSIAANERRHAEIWATRLSELGEIVPPPTGARLRVRAIIALARVFGTHSVREFVLALEGNEEQTYMAQAAPEVEAIAADEREHAAIWRRLAERSSGPARHRHRRSRRAAVAQAPRSTRARRGASRAHSRSPRASDGIMPAGPARSGRSSSASPTGSSPTSPS